MTLVDESRVYHIEGKAPEGVEIGDVAHYFNAETGNNMQVVSWTGDEWSFGASIQPGSVATAFTRLRTAPAIRFGSSGQRAIKSFGGQRRTSWRIGQTVADHWIMVSFYWLLFFILPQGAFRQRATVVKKKCPNRSE